MASEKKAFKLDENSRLTIQNIMLKIALERERINRYRSEMEISEAKIQSLEEEAKLWQKELDVILKENGYDKVSINAETGEVIPTNVLPIQSSEKINGSSQ